jgi:pseudo-rSAM protein
MEENWLIIHPWTYICCGKNNTIFYNCVSNKFINHKSSEALNQVINQLDLNNQVIKIGEALKLDYDLEKLFWSLRSQFFCDIIPTNSFKSKPVSIPFRHKIQSDLSMDSKSVLPMVNEITIHLDSYQGTEFNTFLDRTGHPLSFFIRSPYKALSLPIIRHIANSFEDCDLASIKVFVSQCKDPEVFSVLHDMAESAGVKIEYYLPVQSISKVSLELLDHGHIHIVCELGNIGMAPSQFNIVLPISSPDEFQRAKKLDSAGQKKFLIGESIESNGGFSFNYKIANVLEKKITSKDIFRNQSLNRSMYGKIYISNTGVLSFDKYSSLPIQLNENVSIPNAIFESISKRNHPWFLTRKTVVPCNDCEYRGLCPPITPTQAKTKNYAQCDLEF